MALPATRADVAALLHRERLPRPDAVAALARRCVVLAPSPSPPAGRTRLGGVPELAVGARWPIASTGAPLTFICQIDLAEIAPLVSPDALPTTGLLGCFYGLDSGPPEFAITLTGPDQPVRAADPPDRAEVLTATGVDLRPAWSLPAIATSGFLAHLPLTTAESDELSSFLSLWPTDHMPLGNHVLGHARDDDAYLGAALDTDPSLRERFFAQPVRERTLRGEFLDAANSFVALASFNETYTPGLGGDGAWLTYLLRDQAWQRGALAQRTSSTDGSTWWAWG